MSLSLGRRIHPRRANGVVHASLPEVLGALRAAPALAIRWGLSADVKFMLRERTGDQGRGVARKSLIRKGFRVRLGSGPDGGGPPPLRFARQARWGAELLPPRKMGVPLGGAGGALRRAEVLHG